MNLNFWKQTLYVVGSGSERDADQAAGEFLAARASGTLALEDGKRFHASNGLTVATNPSEWEKSGRVVTTEEA